MTLILQIIILLWSFFLISFGGYMIVKRQLPNGKVVHHPNNTHLVGILLAIGGLFIGIGTTISLVVGSTTLSSPYVLVSVIPVFAILAVGSDEKKAQSE